MVKRIFGIVLASARILSDTRNAGLLLLLFLLPSYAAVAAEFSPDREYVYKTVGDTELKLHVFNPPNHNPSDKRPAIVFFFGGGWISGNPSQFYPHCAYLAARGMLESIRSGAADERDGDFLMTGGKARVSKDGDWTETYACNLIDWHLKEQETMPWLTGTAYWPFKDFSTPIRPENPVPYVNQKGVVERDLTPKESFYVFQSYWTDAPMIRIYGHSWPVRWGAANEPKMVKIYSNCESVELVLNGESLGRRTRNSQDYPAAGLRWVTPFRSGTNTLRAVGCRDGATVEDELVFEYQEDAWSAPARLRLELISQTDQLATAQAYALDANGVRCLDAKGDVEFSLVGDGGLIADLGTSTASRKVQLYNGRAQISFRRNGGTSVLCVESPGLPTVFLNVPWHEASISSYRIGRRF